jgi:outer membrane protein, multidrug efflux system
LLKRPIERIEDDRMPLPASARRRGPLLGLLVLAAGCRVGPEHEPPDLSARTDPAWRNPSGPELTAEREQLARWWEQLGSPELSELAARLWVDNLSLSEARQRVLAARARRGVVAGERLPEVYGEATYMRAGTGDDSLNFQGPPPGRDVDVFSLGASAAWELDLWGRVGRLVESADAEVDIAIEDHRDAAVSLLAELALAYIDARALHLRLDVLERSIALQEETARLARSRFEAGNGARLDVEQAARELELSRARVPELRRALRAAENRVAILVGERPRDGLVAAEDELALPASIGLGLPADLLVRRADVRRAERRLAAAVARIGSAEAERYPRVSLTGTVALRAQDVDTLFGGADALSYSLGPGLSIPLFTGGRIDSEVAFREARAEEARLAFERTLLEAIAEVETAGEGVVRTRQRVERLEAAVESARAAAALAQELFDAGLRDLLQVVDAQRAQVATEDELLVAWQAALARTVELYRALGGGWDVFEGDAEEAIATAEGGAR